MELAIGFTFAGVTSTFPTMPLPDLIEIVPLDKPVHAEITVPGSKSITNRALVLAALANGEVTLEGALWSEDTQVMVDCLVKLGFDVRVDPDPNEFCNRTITVRGRGGEIPRSGTAAQPLELFVGNAGTAARFLSAMVCLGSGVYRLSGVPRMHERPQAALFRALRELGYRVDSANDKLPAVIHGKAMEGRVPRGPRNDQGLAELVPPTRNCQVSIEHSSQFASALLLCAEHGGWEVEVTGENAEESPYVAMTVEMVKVFPHGGGTFQIEPDASSGSYFWAAECFVPHREVLEYSEQFGIPVPTTSLNTVKVAHWPTSDWQVDVNFPGKILLRPQLNYGLERARNNWEGDERFVQQLVNNDPNNDISRTKDLGDSILTAIVLAPFSVGAVRFTDLGRLRVQECERVVALRTELTKCGAKVIEAGDTLEVFPSKLHGAEIETYDDHRMAMCFAVLGLKVPGIRLRNPSCVKKTFPNFFQKLAAAPPHGLGVTIRDGKTGQVLSHDELFAE
jgi:3-phosphoshikimate 1-carboxyvinyltransferase